MQTERRVAANPQTKPTDLGRRSAAIIHRHQYSSLKTENTDKTTTTIITLDANWLKIWAIFDQHTSQKIKS